MKDALIWQVIWLAFALVVLAIKIAGIDVNMATFWGPMIISNVYGASINVMREKRP
jgi:hypothetical protein